LRHPARAGDRVGDRVAVRSVEDERCHVSLMFAVAGHACRWAVVVAELQCAADNVHRAPLKLFEALVVQDQRWPRLVSPGWLHR